MKIEAKQRLLAEQEEQDSPHDSTLNNILKHIVEASNAANLLKHTLRGSGDSQKSNMLRELQVALDKAAQEVHDIKSELQADQQTDDDSQSAPETPESIAAMLLSTSEPTVDSDLVSDGSAFETLNDGDPDQDEPLVQDLTKDDGDIQPADEQVLLMDDIPYRRP